MKRYLFITAIFIFFAYYISRNIAIISETITVSLQTALGYQLLASIFVLFAVFSLGNALKYVFRIFHKGRKTSETTKVILQTQAINVLFPTGGFSVAAIYGREAKKHKEPVVSAVASFIVNCLAGYIALLIILIFAVIYLYLTHTLTALVVVPTIILFFAAFGLLLLLYLSTNNPVFVTKLLTFCNQILAVLLKLFKRNIDPKRGINDFVGELSLAYDDIRADPRSMVRAIGYILLSHLLSIIALEILFLSFGFHPLYQILIAGYAVCSLLTVVSPSPSGVGFAEAGMVFTYTSLGIDMHLATTISILYRGLSFWLPLFVGFVLLQRDGLLKSDSKKMNNQVSRPNGV